MLRLALYIMCMGSFTLINSYSQLENNLLRVARKLDGNEEQNEDYSWLIDYSLKFSSCHTATEYIQDEEGVISMQKLVQFRICPSNECSWRCKGGRYLVQMEDFLLAYANQKEANKEYACEKVREQCVCDDDDGDGGNNNCEADCFFYAGLDYCVEGDDVSRNT